MRIALLLLTASVAQADVVTLKNGDRLTGTILKSDAKALVIKTEFAGTVTLDWTAVVNVSSPETLTITLKPTFPF
ncbi:MAG: hypothetical protein FJW40_17695 [Acidobacteria bacterium]|nr:hypothetical protein [Acidobacteriota bacterium]